MGRTRAIVEVLVVYAALVAWLVAGGRALGGAFARGNPTVAIATQIVATAVVAVVLVLVATRGDRDRVDALGLKRAPLRDTFKRGVLGMLVSYAATTLAVAAFFAITRLSPAEATAAKARGLAEIAKASLAVMLPIVFVVGFYEELVFRGFVLGRLRRAIGPGRDQDFAAVVLGSALFALGHGYQGALGVVQTFVAGIVLSYLYVRTGTIWASVVAHVGIDAVGLILIRVAKRAGEIP